MIRHTRFGRYILFKTLNFLVCVLLVLSISHMQLNKSKPVIKSAQRSLCLLFCLGAAMTCLSLLSFLGENTDSNCVQRPWLFHISVTIMFGALFVKVYRVWRVFDNPSLKTRHLTLGAMYKKLAMLVCVDLVILLVWTLASPSEVRRSRRENVMRSMRCGGGWGASFFACVRVYFF